LSFFGPQGWWPADSPFEVIVGAILTQNTAWTNVEKAIANLKKENLLCPEALYKVRMRKLARLIRPCGYYNIKAARLKNFIDFLFSRFGGSLSRMFRLGTDELRSQLLSIKGIGWETADSILLYADNRPIFVVDAYTRRIFACRGLLNGRPSYEDIQTYVMKDLPRLSQLYNEFHALIVRLGKDFCRKSSCQDCPVRK
jgi:endonuclease-3 related protein